MREIKFRGKREDNGEWVYGYPIIVSYKAWIKDINDTTTNPRILAQDFADFRCVEVEKETVGQYTGLKDRNGVEIYEGDVLRNVDNPHVDKLPFKVVWSDYYGAWFWWSSEGEVVTDYFYQYIAKYCEIIGNIHDNPELMGEMK